MDVCKKKRPAQSIIAKNPKKKKLDVKDVSATPDPDLIRSLRDNQQIPSEGSKLAQHGNIFQLKLLMLLLWRAKTHGYESFRLATELSECDKFDDVVFQYEKGGNWWNRLVQAKHKEGLCKTTATVTSKDLLSTDKKNEFGLQKYFNSFLKIKQRCASESLYSILPSSTIQDVIICTNISVAEDVKSSLTDIDLPTDDIFYIIPNVKHLITKPSACKINVSADTKIVSELRCLLLETGDLYALIDVLSDAIANEKPIDRVSIVKDYQYLLSSKVFDVESEGTFRKTFLDAKHKRTENEKLFRKLLLKEIIVKMKLKDGNSLPDVKVDHLDGLKVSRNFANAELTTDEGELRKLAWELAGDVRDKKIHPKNYTCLAVLLKHVVDGESGKFHVKFLRSSRLKTLLKQSLLKRSDRKFTDDDLSKVKFDTVGLDWPKDCSELFDKILEHVVKKKQFDENSFDPHHLLICEHVIDAENKTWRENFLAPNANEGKPLPPQVKRLRRMLIDKMVSDGQLNAKSIRDMKIKFSKGYVNAFLPRETFDLDGLEEFAETLCNIITNSGVQVQISERSVTTDELETFKNNMQSLAGHVLTRKYGKVRFRSRFLSPAPLSNDLAAFRIQLRKGLGAKFETLCEYEFDIQDIQFETCDEDLLEAELPVASTAEDVEEFFDKLKILADFPNRHQMTHVMMKEMQDHFRELDSKDFNALYQERLHDWMAKRIGTFYTTDGMNNMFESLRNDILSRKMEGVTKSYLSNIYGAYEFLDYSDFVDFLNDTVLQVLHVYTDSMKLSRLRIGQTFKKASSGAVADSLKPYIWKGGQLFVTSSQLRDDNFSKNVQKSYQREINLLVVECETGDVPGVFTRFADIIVNIHQPVKKLILITELDKHRPGSTPNNMDTENITVFEVDSRYNSRYRKATVRNKVSCLQQISKAEILKKTITFQGEPLPLSSFLELEDVINDQVDEIIDTETLEKLITSERPISICSSAKFGITDACYIERSFRREMVIPEADIIDDKCKAIVISDVAGMGKSTTLTKLPAYFEKTLWVLRIDLNDYTQIFAKELEEKSHDLHNPIEVIKFLLKYDTNMPTFRTPFERNLLLYNFQKIGNVVFLLDGFDEICPNYKHIALRMLRTLRKSNAKRIIVTTRPHFQEDLEEVLGTSAYKMVPFSKDAQKDFLVKFWRTRLCNVTNTRVDERIEAYASFLVDNFSKVIDSKIETFTGIALQLRMVAEIFFENADEGDPWQGCKEFLLSGDDQPRLPARLDLYSLYTEFVNRKFEIYCSAKKKEDGTNVAVQFDRPVLMTNFFENHELLAMYSIFYQSQQKHLLPAEKVKEIFDSKQNAGLVTSINDSYFDRTGYRIPQFIHRTFDEYFIARYISNMLLNGVHSEEKYESLWQKILMEILFNTHYTTIHCFLESRLRELLKKDKPQVSDALKHTLDSLWDDGKLIDSFHKATPFHQLARNGYLNILKTLWNISSEQLKNAVVDSGDKHRATMLHLAAERGDLEMVKWLATPRDVGGAGADVEARESYDYTPIRMVTENIDVIKWLATSKEDGGGGADINIQDCHGQKLIHVHIETGRIEVAKWLLETKENGGGGVSVDVEDADGLKLIHYIANSQYFKELLSWLISRYTVDIHETDGAGNTILHYAAYKGQRDILRWLVTPICEGGVGGDITVKSAEGSTLLHEAVSSGNVDLVEWLIGQNKIAVLHKDENGRTAFHEAARLGSLDIIKVLSRECSVDSNDTDASGKSVLQEAACFGQCALVKFLVCSSNRDLTTNIDHGILHLAARHGELALVRWLVEEIKLDPERRDEDGRSVLHVACKHANIEVGKWLIAHYTKNGLAGVINAVDVKNRTPLHEIIQSNLKTNIYNWLDVRNVFIKSATIHETGIYEINFPEEMPVAIKSMVLSKMTEWGNHYEEGSDSNKIRIDTFDLIRVLVRAGARLDVRDATGKTALHEAVSGHLSKALPLIQLLLDERMDKLSNVDFTSEDNERKTVLHYAVDSSETDLVAWLLSSEGGRFDLDTHYSDGMSIIRYAFLAESKDTLKLMNHDKTLQYLSEIIRKDENYLEYLVCAVEFENLDILKWVCNPGKWAMLVEDTEGRNTFYYAVKHDRLSVLRWMVAPELISGAGVDVNVRDRHGESLLHYASRFNRANIVKWLLALPKNKGGTVNIRTSDNLELTPLEHAVKFNSLDVVKVLLTTTSACGDRLDVEDRYWKRRTILHFAVSCADMVTIKWLATPRYEHGGGGADANATDEEGKAPLHHAVEMGRLDVVRWLATSRCKLGGGADVNAEDAEGRTPLIYSVTLRQHAIMEWMVLSRGQGGGGADIYLGDATGKTILHQLAEQGEVELLRGLERPRHQGGASVDIRIRDKHGRSCLHYAGISGQRQAIEWFVSSQSKCGHGMDVNDKDGLGKTCLEYAVENGHTEAVEHLNTALELVMREGAHEL